MKNTTLLKVLSATAIFSAVAAIEAYDQDSFAFAAEETPVVTNTTTSSTKPITTQPAAPASTTGETNSPATPAVNSAATPATTSVTAPATTAPKAEEPATVAQDVKALKDGEYKITAEALKFYEEGQPSMAAAAIDNEKTKLIVKNGKYSVNVSFKPITFGGLRGYLGDLKYYDGDKTHENRKEIQKNEFKDSTIVENYSASETDNFVDTYKKEFPGRTVYPKTVNYNVDKNKIDSNNKLETYTEVFVPVMASINPAFGTQKMTLKFDLTSLSRTKVTADNYEAATYKNPNKDVEYTGKINKEFPIHVQGHFRNANNNDEESLYGSALDSYVKVEKVGDKYKYTLRFKKGLADVGGEFYPFELHKVAYEGKDIPLTTLATNGNSSVKEGSITTDKLLEKIQLDGTAPYPNGALMSHFVTLKLYYETATAYKERPVKLEDVVAPSKPKPTKPTPAPVKPKEEPKPAAPTVPDHAVTADKVPATFPTTVKGELKYQKDNEQISTYANLFEKDVKIEKQDSEYKYTFKIKEATGNTFVTKRTKYQFSKISYNGNNALITPLDGTNKEVSFTTNQLLDKVQLKMTVVTKQDKKGNEIDATLDLNFPTVEKVKEEAANNLVPAKINNAHVADKPSMADGALVHEKTRVEKVNDSYHYYLTFKDLSFGAQVGTVDTLTVDNTAAERTDLGGEGHEKVFHFTSPDKLTEKTITFSVSVDGKPLIGHSNVAATLKFNWDAATPLTADQVTSLHNDETTKAQAEKEKLEREKAEADRLEKERLEKEAAAKAQAEKEKLEREKAEADRLEKERLEKEAAAKAQAEKEKLEKEKAEADRLEKEKLEKEAAAKAQAEKERLEKEAATKAQAEKERLEKEAATKAQAEKERLEKEAAAKAQAEKERLEREKAEADRLAKEKAEREKAEADRLAKEKAEREKAEAAAKAENERLEKEAATKAEKERLVKEVKAVEKTVTELKANKAQLEKLVKEKEEAINNATTEVEKEKLTTEKATVEKELTAKVTELKAENEKVVKLKFKAVKNQAVENILKDRSLSDKEIKQLEAIVKTASLKDTLVAKVVENDPSQDVTVTFDNTAIQADHLVVQKADEKTVADVKEKVEELAKKADKNLSVVKTIDLHFADSKGNEINKQGETRAVTLAVVANEGEKLEVYYVRETDDKNIVLEKVPSVYKDGNLTFFTNHFSRYSIVKSNSEKPSTSDTSSTSTNGNTSASTETPKSSEVNPDKASAQTGEQASSQDKALNNENKATSTESEKDNVFGQENNKVENNENKLDVVKTNNTPTPQNVEQNAKASLAKTGLSTTATAGLGALLLLSALVLRRKSNK